MSKRRRRRRDDRVNTQSSSNFANNIPFGINPAQLMNLLGGNIDINQIGNMMSSMKTDGIDLNNFNLNQPNNNQSGAMGLDFGPLQNIMKNLGFGNLNISNNNASELGYKNSVSDDEKIDNSIEEFDEEINEEFLEDDENVQMLIAIKSIVDSKKAIFLDKVIEAYNKGEFK